MFTFSDNRMFASGLGDAVGLLADSSSLGKSEELLDR